MAFCHLTDDGDGFLFRQFQMWSFSITRLEISRSPVLKLTTTLFSLSDHYILSQEWRVIVDQVHTNGTIISQVWPSCWLWGILIMVGCVLSQLKPSELYILSCGKDRGLQARFFPQVRMQSSSGFILYDVTRPANFAALQSMTLTCRPILNKLFCPDTNH